ncbi:hypothetical protein [Comamonas terrigena]|nr:hypothetical protein [Comamonas terrigena]
MALQQLHAQEHRPMRISSGLAAGQAMPAGKHQGLQAQALGLLGFQ